MSDVQLSKKDEHPMPYISENVKASRLSALAQLCEIHIANGLTTTAELVAKTGYGERSIRAARAELEYRNSSTERNSSAGTLVPERNSSAAPQKEIPPTPPKEKTTLPRTTVEQASHRTREPEDELLAGLNGSTAIIVRDVAQWANMPETNSRKWLATTVSVFGTEVTKLAYQKLQTDLATGMIIADPLRTMSIIAKRLKTEGAGKPAPSDRSKWARVVR
jgi:hypothetical protein